MNGIPKHQKIATLQIQPGYLTVNQAALLLGWSDKRVSNNMDRGNIAEAKVSGIHRRRLVRRDVLERFARNHGIEINNH